MTAYPAYVYLHLLLQTCDTSTCMLVRDWSQGTGWGTFEAHNICNILHSEASGVSIVQSALMYQVQVPVVVLGIWWLYRRQCNGVVAKVRCLYIISGPSK
jgi:hypothetical protein